MVTIRVRSVLSFKEIEDIKISLNGVHDKKILSRQTDENDDDVALKASCMHNFLLQKHVMCIMQLSL